MEKEIKLSNQASIYLFNLEKRWHLGKKVPEHRNKDEWCMVKRKLSSYFSFLYSKKIEITIMFMRQMQNFDFEKMISFFDKCKCFYENRPEKWTISSLCLRSKDTIEKLLKYNHEDIKFIARHPFYKNILAIYHWREFPSATMVREVDTWVNIREGITPKWIWNNLSLNSKSSKIPEKEER